MKINQRAIYSTFLLIALAVLSSCGLQVRDNPTITGNNPVVVPPAEKTYTVGGIAFGIRYESTDPTVPTGYFDNLPPGIVLTINGEEFPLNQNGTFTFDKEFISGDDYEVSIVDNGIVIPNIDPINFPNPIYLNCDIGNATGTIIDHDVTDVVIKCYFSDSPYPDPA